MRRVEGERGAAAVELALVLPVLVLLIFGMVDIGLAIGSSNTLGNAVREGARLGVVDHDAGLVEDQVRRAARDLDQSRLAVTVACKTPGGSTCPGGLSGAKSGDRIEVSVTYPHELLTPFAGMIGRDSITLTAQSEMRIEG